ncbi:MAG TPA: hypothetical protein PLO56_15260 [Rhodothermales bacterium]|mgnify:CR=1 FL=1|nr:hypothetical protein [Rhodothermales bacterium]
MSLLLANDLQTPPKILKELGQNPPQDIMLALLSNPNTPAEVLWRWGHRAPEVLLENPVLPLLIMENPRIFAEMQPETAMKLVTHPRAWDELLLLATQGRPLVRLALTQLPSPPKMVLDKLMRDRNPHIRLAASLHILQLTEPETDWMERADAHVLAFLKGLTPSTWEGELFRLCLRHSPLPDFIFAIMAEHGQEYVRATIAENPFLSPRYKEKLRSDRSEAVRLAACRDHPAKQHQTQPALWQHQTEKLAETFILTHPESPEEWVKLAQNPDVALREAVALHPKTPVEVLVQLAKSQEMRIQRAVARNPNTPPEVLEEILSDLRHIERDLAEQNPVMRQIVMNMLGRSKEAYFSVFYLVQCPILVPERFQNKCHAPSWIERYVLARHPEIPLDWLAVLLDDPNRYVRNLAHIRINNHSFSVPPLLLKN